MLISAVIGSMAGSLPSTVLHFSFAGMFFLFAWISVDVVIISFIESRIATTAAIIVIMVATIVSRPFIILSSIIAIVSMSASFIPPCAGRGHTRSRRIGRMGARAGSTTPIISSPAPLPLFVSFVMFISASATAPLSFGISTPTLSFTTLPVSMAITIVPRRNVYHDSPPFLIFLYLCRCCQYYLLSFCHCGRRRRLPRPFQTRQRHRPHHRLGDGRYGAVSFAAFYGVIFPSFPPLVYFHDRHCCPDHYRGL
mmetsp:Transcript_22489/g.36773  ORF Transcript_22489/g.36773 Transcript_22489/m.36773 type:complete len:253 (-) Transcript_22489:115-873(-)